MTSPQPERTPSAIDQLANELVEYMLDVSPLFASSTGFRRTGGIDDFSPEADKAHAEHYQATLTALRDLDAVDEVDLVTKAAMEERLGLDLEIHEARESVGVVNNLTTPFHAVRDSFDLMETETDEDWDLIRERIAQTPRAMAEYAASVKARVTDGPAIPTRQIEALVKQVDQEVGDNSVFSRLTKQREDLAGDATRAREAMASLAETLRETPTTDVDGVGRERYSLHSRYFLGATIDLDETYDWGQDVLASIVAEQESVARELYGDGVSVREAMDRLNDDPERQLHGTEALREWMQATADEAMAAMPEHFDIPEELKRIEACIASSGTGGIYYTGPSDDMSRAGRMWWSVPPNVETFTTWLEKTTVYHEGVPGHHLQVGMQTYLKDQLNGWRRHACWVSGHGEGWALYAERFMDELGFLSEPGDRMGMLDSQRLRAARVVVDLGVHVFGWSREKAWEFLTDNVAMEHTFLAFELDRYMGWPGQAPSYKIGQRIWEDLRAESEARGESLRDFHNRALALGSVGLDVLREALSR